MKLELERPIRLAGRRTGFAFCLFLSGNFEGSAAAASLASGQQQSAMGKRPSGASPIWRAGSPLAAQPAVGPDGAIYVASRQGTLEVLEATGALRFAITLGGAPTGAMYVDRKGEAYFGLATGKIVAVSAQGQRRTLFVSPTGIGGGVGYSEELGILFSAPDGVVFGISRMGVPTVRIGARGRIAAGPLGAGVWCVAVTAHGEMLWGDRMGRRFYQPLGTAVTKLLATPNGGLWAQAEGYLIGLTSRREESFRRSGIVAMTTVVGQPVGARGIHGAVITAEQRLEWLDSLGASVLVAELVDGTEIASESLTMTMDSRGVVWVQTAPGRLVAMDGSGVTRGRYSMGDQQMFEPVIDSPRHRTLVGMVAGEVFSLVWPDGG